MTIRMTESTGKNVPVSITTHITCLPARSLREMQSDRYVLIGWLAVDDWLYRFVSPCGIYVHPAVFLCIVRNWIILVSHTLSVGTMSRLVHMEINPRRLRPPFCRRVATARMESHKMLFIYRLNGFCQGCPHFRLDISLNISADNPDDIRKILVSLSEESAVGFRSCHVHRTAFHESAPDANHADVDILTLCHADDVIHVVPVIDSQRVIHHSSGRLL